MKRSFLVVIVVLILFLVVLPVISAFLLLDHTSVVYDTIVPEVEHASRLKSLAKRTIKKVLGEKETAVLKVSEKDLNSLMAFASRSIKRFSGYISIEDKGMVILASVRLPNNPAGNHLNFKVYLKPSNKRLNIYKVHIGDVSIPGGVAYWLMEIFLNVALGNNQGSEILNSVTAVTFHGETVSVYFTPIPDLEARLSPLKEKLKNVRDIVNPICDPSVVGIYYSKLLEIEQELSQEEKVTLARFMGPLFELAAIRSNSNPPEDENRDAILALSVFAGDWWFKQVIGDMEVDGSQFIKSSRLKIVLSDRNDLRLHFVISAGLEVVSNSDITFSTGELKELLDAVTGGSGFSFIDLAADRAGIKFAQTATDKKGGAQKLQSVMSGQVEESLFFPDINTLPEGISQEDFENTFRNVESASYKSLVRKIDDRIDCLPAYGQCNQ